MICVNSLPWCPLSPLSRLLAWVFTWMHVPPALPEAFPTWPEVWALGPCSGLELGGLLVFVFSLTCHMGTPVHVSGSPREALGPGHVVGCSPPPHLCSPPLLVRGLQQSAHSCHHRPAARRPLTWELSQHLPLLFGACAVLGALSPVHSTPP